MIPSATPLEDKPETTARPKQFTAKMVNEVFTTRSETDVRKAHQARINPARLHAKDVSTDIISHHLRKERGVCWRTYPTDVQPDLLSGVTACPKASCDILTSDITCTKSNCAAEYRRDPVGQNRQADSS